MIINRKLHQRSQDDAPIGETYIPEQPVAFSTACTPGPGQRCLWQSIDWPGGLPAAGSNVHIPQVRAAVVAASPLHKHHVEQPCYPKHC